ncbi:MAG TPA: PAS domain-containing protein [Candidatus Acidoferrum sp.]
MALGFSVPKIMKPLRILIVDNHEVIRRSLRSLLSSRPEWEICGEAADGRAAIERAKTLRPDVILMDVTMLEMCGAESARIIHQEVPEAQVIIISQNDPEITRQQANGAGATAYVAKSDLSRDLLAVALELGRIGTWDRNLSTGKAFWSSGLYSLHGYAPGECEASWESWRERVHPADYERVSQVWQAARAARKEYGFEYRVLLPDGKVRWIEVKGRFFCDESGEPSRDLGAAQDVTDRKIVEERLLRGRDELEEQVRGHRVELQERASEAANQAELLDLANDAAFICGSNSAISYWNRGAERLYGWKQADVVGRHPSELLRTKFPIPRADLLAILERDGRWEGELVQTTRYGLRMTVHSRWTCKYADSGEFIGWLEINSDMTQQKQAEETARRLSGRILQVQDEERRRMARDLHDSLGQYLAMLKICIDGSLRTLTDSAAKKHLEQACEMVEQCVSETRTLSHLLHPPLLDENGLSSAVRWYVEGFGNRSGIEVKLNMPRVIPRFLNEIETTLFRILQEGLTNVHRHSQSKRVDVDISHDQNMVSLVIRDYGLGIPLERIRAFRDFGSGMGVGLGGMRERIREVGGTLRIEPGKESGTVISVEIPLVERPETKFSDDLSEIDPPADSLPIRGAEHRSQGRPN